jgi:hypothetical protein
MSRPSTRRRGTPGTTRSTGSAVYSVGGVVVLEIGPASRSAMLGDSRPSIDTARLHAHPSFMACLPRPSGDIPVGRAGQFQPRVRGGLCPVAGLVSKPSVAMGGLWTGWDGPASASSSAPGVAPAVQDERSIALCRRVAACGGGHRAHGCGGGRVPFSRTSSRKPLPTPPCPDTALSMAAPTTIPVPTSTVYAKPTRNPAPTVQIGFETGLAGWRPIGAAWIQRDPLAREGRWVARFNGGSRPGDGPARGAAVQAGQEL